MPFTHTHRSHLSPKHPHIPPGGACGLPPWACCCPHPWDMGDRGAVASGIPKHHLCRAPALSLLPVPGQQLPQSSVERPSRTGAGACSWLSEVSLFWSLAGWRGTSCCTISMLHYLIAAAQKAYLGIVISCLSRWMSKTRYCRCSFQLTMPPKKSGGDGSMSVHVSHFRATSVSTAVCRTALD